MEKKDFKILIVDDDEMVREVVSAILSKEGYPVAQGKDGFDAISLLMVGDVKLVITDLKMPRADGIRVLENAVKNNPDIAVVIMTAYSTLETALEAMRRGAYDYLTKPFKMEEIIFVVEKAFEREGLIQENKELRSILRSTYRDIEAVRSITGSNNLDVIAQRIERVERLKSVDVLTEYETKILKERLLSNAYGKGTNS